MTVIQYFLSVVLHLSDGLSNRLKQSCFESEMRDGRNTRKFKVTADLSDASVGPSKFL